jgi:hypothetical protein
MISARVTNMQGWGKRHPMSKALRLEAQPLLCRAPQSGPAPAYRGPWEAGQLPNLLHESQFLESQGSSQ